MVEMRNAYNIFVRKPGVMRPLKRPRHRWEDNIGMYLRELFWDCLDWMHLAEDTDWWQALVNTVMNLLFP
jgi:hypothetical protein